MTRDDPRKQLDDAWRSGGEKRLEQLILRGLDPRVEAHQLVRAGSGSTATPRSRDPAPRGRGQHAGGTAQGLERVVAQARRTHDVPTQHVVTNVLADLDGDRATAGANLIVSSPRALRVRRRPPRGRLAAR